MLFEFCLVNCSIISNLLLRNLNRRRKFRLTLLPIIVKLSQISIFDFLIISLTLSLNSLSRVSLLNKFHVIKMSCVLLPVIILIDVASPCQSMYIRHLHFERCCCATKSKRFLVHRLGNSHRLLRARCNLVSV